MKKFFIIFTSILAFPSTFMFLLLFVSFVLEVTGRQASKSDFFTYLIFAGSAIPLLSLMVYFLIKDKNQKLIKIYRIVFIIINMILAMPAFSWLLVGLAGGPQ